MMSLSLHGVNNSSAWEAADIPDFLRELVTLKYFKEASGFIIDNP